MSGASASVKAAQSLSALIGSLSSNIPISPTKILNIDSPVVGMHETFRAHLLKLAGSNMPKAQSLYDVLVQEPLQLRELERVAGVHRISLWGETTSLRLVRASIIDSTATAAIPAATSVVSAALASAAPAPASKPYIPSTQIVIPELSAQQIYPGHTPHHYRDQIYTAIDLTGTSVKLFVPTDIVTRALPDCVWDDEPLHYSVTVPFAADPSVWTAVMTLTSNDKVRLADDMAEFYDLGYSKTAAQYYVRAKVVGSLPSLAYDLFPGVENEMRLESLASYLDVNSLTRALAEFQFGDPQQDDALRAIFQRAYTSTGDQVAILRNFLSDFAQAELSTPSEAFSLSTLNAMLKEKKGVCLQRAVLFMAFSKILKIPAQMVVNDIHVFAQVKMLDSDDARDEKLFRVDFGGGNPRLTISPALATQQCTMQRYSGFDSTPYAGIRIYRQGDAISQIKLSLYAADYYKQFLLPYGEILQRFSGVQSLDSQGKHYSIPDLATAVNILTAMRSQALSVNSAFISDVNFVTAFDKPISELNALLLPAVATSALSFAPSALNSFSNGASRVPAPDESLA